MRNQPSTRALHRGAHVQPNPRGNRKLEEMRDLIPQRRKRRQRVKKLPKQPIHD